MLIIYSFVFYLYQNLIILCAFELQSVILNLLSRHMNNQKEKQLVELKQNVYSREEYAKANFWDDRYAQKGGFFDWYAQFPELQKAFNQFTLIKTDKILMVGCGNSKLSDQMYQAGYKNIVNIDISPTVIQQMKQKFPYMVWEVVDATDMPYKNGQFDAIIDKGTLDALISGKNFDICHKMLEQCARVTKKQGQLLLITYGSPQGRRKIFQTPLPFDQFDYYYYKAELNDMSTMINLMRSNLPGKKLSSILTQKDAFLTAMKEFSIIKMMRKVKKNTKQYVVWKSYEKCNIQINPNHDESKNLQQFKGKNENKIEQKNQKTQQKIQKGGQIKQINEKQSQTFNYAPKKQAYVYVYSIRQKLAASFENILKDFSQQTALQQFPINQNKNILIEGDKNLTSFTLNINNQAYDCLRAVKYLRIIEAAHSNVLLTSNQNDEIQNSLYINIIPSSATAACYCFKKTNFNFIVKFNIKVNIEYVLNSLKNIDNEMKNRCNLHPNPKIYEHMFKLKQAKSDYSINSFLKKYWYPTWKIHQMNDKQVNIQFSIPPISDNKIQEIYNVIKQKLKLNSIQFVNYRAGYISQYDQKLMNIINMACLSYCGNRVQVLFQEFWQKQQNDAQLSAYYLKDSQYNELRHTFSVPDFVISKSLVHLLSLY